MFLLSTSLTVLCLAWSYETLTAKATRQTTEPRVSYLLVSFKAQSHLHNATADLRHATLQVCDM